ncbi:MAG: ATP-binding cassette domain-containing protein [Bifidobacteriaceae bacterium]|jgi:ABC-2 type transport system ATP-binding protein|nr:ATP-binding cassette domain-containing protein [Bifidobacteriaceae bacterium]
MTPTPTPPPHTPPGAPLAVEARGLVKAYGSTRAVDGIDLEVPAGSVFGFLGPNGAGKTTTIRMLATLIRPDAGRATVFGRDVVRQAQQVRQLIGLTGQYASVDEDLTASENLVLFGTLLGLGRTRAKARAKELLADFALTEAAEKPLKQFSGGMRRRLDLAASLVAAPPLIFLDEPTTGLDPRTRNQMWDTIRALAAAGATVLLTTQYLDEADQLADHIAVIDRGRLVAQGTPADLKASVGRSTLELRLTKADDAVTAAAAIAHLTDGSPKAHAGGIVTAPLASADSAATVLAALSGRGIGLTSLSVAQPTLDEVFLTLTGRTPAEAPSDPAAADPSERTAA